MPGAVFLLSLYGWLSKYMFEPCRIFAAQESSPSAADDELGDGGFMSDFGGDDFSDDEIIIDFDDDDFDM